MSVAVALGYGRRAAESRMTEGVLFFTTAEQVINLATSEVRTPVWSGVGRVKFTNTQPSEPEAGEQFPVVSRREVHVPVGSVDATPGMFVEVTSSTADESLVGRVFRVTDRPAAGQTTAWRVPVSEVS